MMFNWFDGKTREIRQLNRDSVKIIEDAENSYRSELIRDIAEIVYRRGKELEERCGEDEKCLNQSLDLFRSLHRESRRKNDQVSLTAYTLLIIDTRAIQLGDEALPARRAIGEFVSHWEHAIASRDEGQE